MEKGLVASEGPIKSVLGPIKIVTGPARAKHSSHLLAVCSCVACVQSKMGGVFGVFNIS